MKKCEVKSRKENHLLHDLFKGAHPAIKSNLTQLEITSSNRHAKEFIAHALNHKKNVRLNQKKKIIHYMTHLRVHDQS